MDELEIAQSFDATGKAYQELGAGFLGEYGRQLLDRLALQRDTRFVDLGCGPGTLISLAERTIRDGEAVGIDLSRTQLEIARERFRRSKLRPRFIHESAAATTLPERHATAVGLSFVLPYADAPVRLLREAGTHLAARRAGRCERLGQPLLRRRRRAIVESDPAP